MDSHKGEFVFTCHEDHAHICRGFATMRLWRYEDNQKQFESNRWMKADDLFEVLFTGWTWKMEFKKDKHFLHHEKRGIDYNKKGQPENPYTWNT